MTSQISQLKIEGMHCQGCEASIIESVKTLPGIYNAKASYLTQSVDVEYDDDLVDEIRIRQTIELKGYGVIECDSGWKAKLRRLSVFLLLLGLVGGVAFWGKSLMPDVMQKITPNMSHALLLSIGFLTGFHCIGMCGGFVVGYTNNRLSKSRQLLSHLSYGFGKTLSYAALGAGFGALGATMAITPQIRGMAALAASIFLVLYGLKMLNVFSVLRWFTLRMPMVVNRQLSVGLRKQHSPFLTGLLSGLLLGCGPLQAMYVMALGSGDAGQGAMMLMLFGLGTLLPLLGFGMFATFLSPIMMRQLVGVSGILVIAMGVMMAQRGLKIIRTNQLPAIITQPMTKTD